MRLRIAMTIAAAAAFLTALVAQAPFPGQNTIAPFQTASITLTTAQIQGMFTTPVLFIPAQGAGTFINVQRCVYEALFGSAAFTGGGAIIPFFGNTSPPVANATGSVAATLLTTFTASQIITQSSMGMAITASAAALNTAVYISNQTAVFASGTGSTLSVTCQYIVTGNL